MNTTGLMQLLCLSIPVVALFFVKEKNREGFVILVGVFALFYSALSAVVLAGAVIIRGGIWIVENVTVIIS